MIKEPRPFHSLLVPIDLSPASDRVVGRVALLPLAKDARVTLVHVVPGSLAPRARKRAHADAARTLETEATSLEDRLERGVRVVPLVLEGAAATEICERVTAVKADMVVMGRGGGRSLRDIFLGSTAERVIRRGQVPVLVVRLPPRAPYRRPALALDVDQAAQRVLEMLLRVIPPPRPTVDVIHAYEPPYPAMIYPSLTDDDLEEYRDHYQQKAHRELGQLLATALQEARVAPDDAPAWRLLVRLGAPRTVVEKAVRKAETDLLVLGTHAHTGVAHAFLGTVAGDVLREVACDVLLIPPSPDGSARR